MRMLTRQIETAQKRVEAMNFETRKNVLKFDDVMNKQREIIYGQRRRVLMGEDVSDSIKTMIYGTIDEHRGVEMQPARAEGELGSHRALAGDLQAHAAAGAGRSSPRRSARSSPTKRCCKSSTPLRTAVYAQTEERLDAGGIDMRENERVLLLRTVDEHWMEHIDSMDQLKQGIGLRSYGQKDPVYAYTSEGFEMFDAMVDEDPRADRAPPVRDAGHRRPAAPRAAR